MPTESLYEERELFSRIAGGDEYAFSLLFDKYYNRIFGKALQVVKVYAVAEDVSQQVFLKVWENREHLLVVEMPVSWLFAIARNLIADRMREQMMEEKYLRFAMDLLEPGPASPEDLVIHRQTKQLLERSMERLSLRQREVYRLSREEGKTYQEIAVHIGIGKDTVKEYMQLALAKIRQYLLEHKEELISLLIAENLFF